MKKSIIKPQFEIKELPQKNIKYYMLNIVHTIIFCLCSLVIGVIIGVFDAVFLSALKFITDLREYYSFSLVPFLCVAGLLIYFLFDRFSKENLSTMYLDFEGEHDKRTKTKLRLIPLVILGTWLTQLFGGSAGTENAAIQTGGTLGSLMSRMLSLKNKNAEKTLTVAGLAAAFGGLFGTPIAAIFFAIEVLSPGYIEVTALLPAMIAAYSSDFFSRVTKVEKFTFLFYSKPDININFVVILCIAAVLFGVVGGLFAYMFKLSKKLLSAIIPNPYVKIALIGFLISVVYIFISWGRYGGTGINIINSVFDHGKVYYWDFIVIFILTILTMSAGYQGGAFIPLFAIGASLGAVIAMLFNMPVVLFAALGYAAVFGAATNTLLAPIFLGAEIFGYEYMPYFFAVCVIAYIFNGNSSIYTKRKNKTIMPHLLMIKK